MKARRIAWVTLAVAMCVSAVWLLLAARNTTFSGDDIYYYARYIAHGFTVEPGHGIEYFFAPHNGHLQAGGKLLYRLLFETVGANYTAFRAVDVLGILISVGLFYVLASRRVGSLVALAPSLLLLFLGYAWEPLIWAFDMHTVYALAFGLAALLALERGDRRGDLGACVLLMLSVLVIELGLAFVVGAAVLVLLRPDRWRRAWIFFVPVALYAIWWLWARQFHQSAIELRNIHLLPIDLTSALSAIAGSVSGLNPTGVGAPAQVTTVTAAGTVIAALAVIGLVVRIRQGSVPPTLWAFLAVAIAYWVTIAMGGRQPDSSRYILAGTVMVFLVAADALSRIRFSPLAIAAAFVLLALVIPPNIAKFYDGRRLQLNDAEASRTEYAMIELARRTVDPGYTAGNDEAVVTLGGGVNTPLPAGDYFSASRQYGSLAYSLNQVREASLLFREVADASLAHALRLSLQEAHPPPSLARCDDIQPPPTPGALVYVPLPRAGLLLGSRTGTPVEVKVSRFAKDGPGFAIGELGPGKWVTLRAPGDAAPARWRVLVGGPVRACTRG